MTKYFLVTYGNLTKDSDKLGKFAIYPVDSEHRGPFSVGDLLFFCQQGGAQDYFLDHPGFENLPDPLRGQAFSQDLLDKLAPANMNLTLTSTMFDLIDKLPKDFKLQF